MKKLSADRKSVLSLIRNSYRHLGELYETSRVYQNPDLLVKKANELFDKIDAIKDDPKECSRIVAFLDNYLDQAISALAEPPARLTGRDICLFCYLAVGFAPIQIMELMGIRKIGTFYSRKSRLKKKIARLGPSRARRYLELLE